MITPPLIDEFCANLRNQHINYAIFQPHYHANICLRQMYYHSSTSDIREGGRAMLCTYSVNGPKQPGALAMRVIIFGDAELDI